MSNNRENETNANRILKAQHELSRILADVVDPLDGLAQALQLAASLPGVDGVWTWFLSPEMGNYYLKEQVDAAKILDLELDVFGVETPLGCRLAAREESIGTWQEIWPEKAENTCASSWSRVAVLPITCHGEVVGALGSGRRDENCVDENCLWMMRTLANAIGSLVASVRNETRHRTMSRNLNHVLDSFTDILFIVDQQGTVLYQNLAAGVVSPTEAETLVGCNIEQVLPGYEPMRRAVAGGENLMDQNLPPEPLQSFLFAESGEARPVEVRINQGDWDGSPAEIIVCRDISGQLDMAHENQRLVTAINQVADSILITDAQGTIEYVNVGCCEATGYDRDELIGQNPRLLKSGEHGDEFYKDMWRTLASGQVWTGRLINCTKSGEHLIEDSVISPIKDVNGVITHFVGVKRDVTADIKVEERLRETQKMEAIGTLAGGIAHDFNNILYALLGYVDLALDDVPAGHSARTSLEEVAKAGERATRLVAKVLAFGRRSDGKRDVVSAVTVVSEGLELVRATMPSTIRIETEMTANDCLVKADSSQLHQVVLNLCTNAQYAMREHGGVLRVSVERIEITAQDSRGADGLNPGSWVCIQVADTGQGIDPAVVDRLFEPYFTTRKPDEGTGLGLATVHGIVTSHGGHVQVHSVPRRGSEFTVYLPVKVVSAETTPVLQEPLPEFVSGSGHIMVIDDEPMVVDVLTRALVRFGFEVSSYRNGIEALEVFRATPDKFDVVVTDQTMPNITGFELASAMLAIRPDLPLILTTGYSEKVGADEALDLGIRYFMSKPLKIKELGEALMELTGTTIGT